MAVTDEAVATSELNRLLSLRQRRAAGLIDPAVENAAIPMRAVVGRYLRHLRGRAVGRKHIEQSLQVCKWAIENGPLDRLGEFNTDGLDKLLTKLADRKSSPRTVNAYRQRLLSLGDWAVKKSKLLQSNPVEGTDRRKEGTDIRKVRRSLTVEEAYRLLSVAGLRRLFYATALWTGLRMNEIRLLEWRDLDLDGERPAITLRACTTKAKRADVLPLHADLVTLLRAVKPPFMGAGRCVFRTIPIRRTLVGGFQGKGKNRHWTNGDLDRAGIPRTDERGRTIDRHALRTTFSSWLADAGVPERKQRALTRHADPDITGKRYTDRSLFDLWAEIAKLPPIRWTGSEAQSLRATGTDNSRAKAVAT